MRFLVLGSGAGGGVPQWNCLCENCRLAFARDGRIAQRTQASVAVSADGESWVLLSASPDLRQQIIDNPELHPKMAPRHSPIKAVFAPNGDVDNIAGLLVMREVQPFTLWATKSVMANTIGGVFGVLNPDVVKRETVEIEQTIDTGFGFTLTPFITPGKIPLYLESRDESEIEFGAESDTTVGVEIRQGRKRFYYMPSCARMTEALRKRLDGAEIVFFDGTAFEDDEMIRLGLLNKTAWRMGHMAMNGDKGTIASLADVAIKRRIFVHVNNSNPALRHDSPERAVVEAAGWEIGFDGMRIEIPAGATERLTGDSRPHLLRGVRLKNDTVRKTWVLLAPERFLRLNAISVDILQRCDGAAPLFAIVDDLATKYTADRAMIERDVRGLLDNLLEKRMLGL